MHKLLKNVSLLSSIVSSKSPSGKFGEGMEPIHHRHLNILYIIEIIILYIIRFIHSYTLATKMIPNIEIYAILLFHSQMSNFVDC